MEYKNTLNNDLDKKIYRYLDFYRVIQMIKNKEMVFVQPKLWDDDDPFENYTLNTEIELPNGDKTTSQFNNSIYCQCWTSNSFSDAMWRLYSPNKMSVRIRTTPRILGEVISDSIDIVNISDSYIGKIKYLTEKTLIKKSISLSKHLTTYTAKDAAIESLLQKRRSFSHEKEIRTLLINDNNDSTNGLLKIKIDPHKLIKGILVDSRAPREILELYKTYLKKELKFEGKVGQSSLYNKKQPIEIEL